MNAAFSVGQRYVMSELFDEWRYIDSKTSLAAILPRTALLPRPGNDELPLTSSTLEGSRIFIAGHTGLVGSAIRRRLLRESCDVLTVDREHLDLRRQCQTENWISANRPDIVILAAAMLDGQEACNARPADILFENSSIFQNVIEASLRTGVRKLVYIGSSCAYPHICSHPVTEAGILPGFPNPADETYALANLNGLKLVQAVRRQHGRDFISILPASLYGPCRRRGSIREPLIPKLFRLIHAAYCAKIEECVVTGERYAPLEFMHVDDCAEGVVHALRYYADDDPVNLGSGEALSMATLTKIIAEVIGYQGRIVFNDTKGNVMTSRLRDCTRIRALGWRPRINLRDGLTTAYRDWRRETLSASLVLAADVDR